MADRSTSNWTNLLNNSMELEDTVTLGSKVGVMAKPVSREDTKSSNDPTAGLTDILIKILGSFSGDVKDLEETKVNSRDVADEVYSKYDILEPIEDPAKARRIGGLTTKNLPMPVNAPVGRQRFSIFPEAEVVEDKVDDGLMSRQVTPEERAALSKLKADDTGDGLMSSPRPKARPSSIEDKAFNSKLLDDLLKVEGMGGDKLTSVPTYSFGITKEKADEYGLEPSQFKTMKEFATAFTDMYVKEKKTENSDVFNAVDEKDHIALMSYLWNTGSFGKLQKKALLNNDMEEFIHEMRDVVHAEGHASSGLSARRAKEANLVGSSIKGWKEITEVKITGTRAKPTFEWLAGDGSVIETFSSTKSLHPGNLPRRSATDTLDDEINL